ncbi:hypothetical protein [Roseovarius aestuariivivens]|uniref:hypothetical protein n=1 Tax=Roseovarius aestuariivivens TaxID=1888910 RepID=UPI00108097FA|nr:hypothetical protein [Roseovarius aestuariivivens]
MNKKFTLVSAMAVVVGLSACAQQEEPAPAPVMPEPTYNKYGHIDHGDHTHPPHSWDEHHHNTLTGATDTF